MSTIKTWILLANITAAQGPTIIGSISDLVDTSKDLSPISRRGISRGLRDLEELEMITVERHGNVSVFRLKGKSENG